MKTYRYFYHYNRQHDKWSVHFKGKCHIVDEFECLVPNEGHTQKQQPKRIVRGFAKEVIIDNNKAIIR